MLSYINSRLLLSVGIFSTLSLAFVFANDGFAAKFIQESFVDINTAKMEVKGLSAGGQFGAELAKGDFNSDGAEDLVVASPFASNDQKQWNGAIKLMFGHNSGGAKEPTDTSINFYGENSGDQLGTSLTVGDLNGDGIDDLAIGAYNAQFKGTGTGKVYILYGYESSASQSGSQSTNRLLSRLRVQDVDFASEKPDMELTGAAPGDAFGVALSTGDVDDNGITDLLVGAPFASTQNVSKVGAVYIFYGTSLGLSPNFNSSIYGQVRGGRFGSVIAVGKIVSKDQVDVLVGAYRADSEETIQSGKVYLYGKIASRSSVFNPKLTFEGTFDNQWFGFGIATGDVNGDSNDDIAITSFPYNGNHQLAKVSIFYGGTGLDEKNPNITIGKPVGESIIGAEIKLKDLNMDGKADVIIGAPGISQSRSSDEGDVYLVYSGKDELSRNYSIKKFEFSGVIHGERPDDWFGSSLEVLDFNNDGFPDLAIGSRYSDAINSINAGKVFVMWGNKDAFGSLKIIYDGNGKEVGRGDLLRIVLERFSIREKKADFIKNCYDHREFCLFNFMAMSSYNGIQLEPKLALYPDVQPENKFYEDINIATMLSLVNGYLNEKDSPFYPELPVTRIQAFKIILSATDLVQNLYEFELIKELGSPEKVSAQTTSFSDVNGKVASKWWYPRYVNFALKNKIIDGGDLFRPDENITPEELEDVINRTLEYLNSVKNEKINT